jgi:hypothetical protein
MKLSKWNLLAAIANGAVLIGLAIYFIVVKKSITFNTTLYNIHISEFNDSNPSQSTVITTPALVVSELALKILIIVYFAFTVFFHIFYATDGFGTGAYTRAIANMGQWIRWLEYLISSGVMTFLISVVVGVKSLDTVILLVVMNSAMILTGWISEQALIRPNGKPIAVMATIIGWILFAGIVAIFFKSFYTGLADANNNGYSIPSFVYVIVIALVLWYGLFGIVSLYWLLTKNRTIQNYLRVEKAYILLSFFSKINLGIALGIGLTRDAPEKKSE